MGMSWPDSTDGWPRALPAQSVVHLLQLHHGCLVEVRKGYFVQLAFGDELAVLVETLRWNDGGAAFSLATPPTPPHISHE